MISPDAKEKRVEETRVLVKECEQQYQDGLITQQEKYNKAIDAWSQSGDKVANAMMEEIKATPKLDDGRMAPINSIYMMAPSGARGSPAQMKQPDRKSVESVKGGSVRVALGGGRLIKREMKTQHRTRTW